MITFAYAADYSKSRKGVAIFGYDATAYFTKGRAVRGKDSISTEWNGATWHFVSKQARELFVNNPEKYAPQFGGYCSNGLKDKHKIEADPQIWRIIDGRLYLYFSSFGFEEWTDYDPSYSKSAAETWNRLKSE